MNSAYIVSVLGWSLVHFFWEAVVIYVIAFLIRLFVSTSSANFRYALSCMTLAAFSVVFVGTVVLIGGKLGPPSESSSTSSSAPVNAVKSGKQEELRPGFVHDDMGLIRLPSEVRPTAYERAVAILSPWMPLSTTLWGVGILICVGLQFKEVIAIRALLRSSTPIANVLRFNELRLEAKLNRSVRFLTTDQLLSPATIGFLRPIVFLPIAINTGFTSTEIDAFVRHELAHIRRFDFLVQVLQICVESIFFFHPCVWLASRWIRDDQEVCCDLAAAPISGGAKTYANALYKLAEGFSSPALMLGANGGSVLHRIRALRLSTQDTKRGLSAIFVATFVIVAVSGTALAAVVKTAAEVHVREYLERTHESIYVFNTLHANAVNPELRPALIAAIKASRQDAPVTDPRIVRLVSVINRGGDPNFVWREYQPLITPKTYPTLLKQYPAWWPYSSAGVQFALSYHLWSAAKHSSDRKLAQSMTRAALLIASMRREQSGIPALIQIVMDPKFDEVSGLSHDEIDSLREYMSYSDDAAIRLAEDITIWQYEGRHGSSRDLSAVQELGGRFDEYAHADVAKVFTGWKPTGR